MDPEFIEIIGRDSLGGPSLREFKDKIGFSIGYKIENLEKICKKKANSNVEGIPACSILQEIVKRTGLPIRHITDSYTIYLKGTQEPSRETLPIISINSGSICGTFSFLINSQPNTKTSK